MHLRRHPREAGEQEALWKALETDAFQVFSSDHAPFRYDDPRGKLVRGPCPPFNEITNGLPGIEARMPMLFSGAVNAGRNGRPPVRRAHVHQRGEDLRPLSTQGNHRHRLRRGPRHLDPDRQVTMSVDILHDEMDYTPYEGARITGWPVTTLLRGEVVCREFEFVGAEGAGRFLRCEAPNRERRDA